MESCMCPRVSQSHSIFTTTTFFSFSFSPPRLLSAHGRIFLPPLSLSRSPSLFNENHAHSAIRVSLSLSRLSVSRSYSVQLAWILSDTHSWTLAHTVLRLLTFPPAPLSYHRPYLRPWPSCVHACRLSPSIASVYTRALPLFIAEQRRTQIPRVRAREMRREKQEGCSGRKGGRTELERDGENERG